MSNTIFYGMERRVLPVSVGATIPGGLVVADGDSITFGYQLTESESYPAKLDVSLGVNWAVTNTAVTGRSVDQMITAATTSVDPQYGVSGSNIVMILGGTNDLASDDSSASVLSSLASYTSARRSVGWTVAIGTILPSGFFNGTQEARRLVVNTAIRDTLSTYGDLLVDFAADSRFDDLDGPNYQDRTHPTSAGTTIMAELVLAVIT